MMIFDDVPAQVFQGCACPVPVARIGLLHVPDRFQSGNDLVRRQVLLATGFLERYSTSATVIDPELLKQAHRARQTGGQFSHSRVLANIHYGLLRFSSVFLGEV
jgi:hypothetical protein